jgi:Asp-tRNA(Asn)/Glu-tRNA(Gln) amidotransferase C subunit
MRRGGPPIEPMAHPVLISADYREDDQGEWQGDQEHAQSSEPRNVVGVGACRYPFA